jgi:plastocyanin
VPLRRGVAIVLGGAVLAAGAAGCGSDEPDLVAGKQAFAEKCASCHVLQRANATGLTGPDLDAAFRQSISEGFGRDGIKGAVLAQIDNPAQVPPDSPAYMPPDLAEGQEAENIAAYVAEAVARPGEDTGLLATAVKEPGGGEPAVAQGGELIIPATAQLAYETDTATAEPGRLTIQSPNPSGTPHNIAIEGQGVDEVGEVVTDGGVSEITVDVDEGEYLFYCSVPGHREGGMTGKLSVAKKN